TNRVRGRVTHKLDRNLRHATVRSIFFYRAHADPRDLHSFPTRRSSDLLEVGHLRAPVGGGHHVLDARLRPAQRQLVEARARGERSEEHTSELQSHFDLVCRLLLEKKKGIYVSMHLRP